ncbi:YggT family protein [Chloroflexota bacterium]
MTFLFNFIKLLCEVLTIVIFLRAILSWVLTSPNTLSIILDKVTEPILAPLRRIIPRAGMFDPTDGHHSPSAYCQLTALTCPGYPQKFSLNIS